MSYGKNVKRIFNLVKTNKNITQLKNQIYRLKMFVKNIPKKQLFENTMEDSYQTNQTLGETTVWEDVNQDSNLIKAMEEAIHEYLQSMNSAD